MRLSLAAAVLNYTIQDIFGTVLALILFSLIFVFPGYVTGWILNLFDFKRRTAVSQMILAMTISASVVPACLFLIYRFTSSSVVIAFLVFLAAIAIYLYIKFYKSSSHANEYKKLSIFFALVWITISILTAERS